MLVNVWAVWFNHCLVKSVISFVPQGALGELPSASVTVWESLWFTVFISFSPGLKDGSWTILQLVEALG